MNINVTKLADQVANTHKITKNTKQFFEKLLRNIQLANKSKSLPINYLELIHSMHRGRVKCNQENCFHITVSANLVDRALSFLNMLVIELEKQQFKIKSIKNQKFQSAVVAIRDHQEISFLVYEGYKYESTALDPLSLNDFERLLYSKKKPIPSGKLTFVVSITNTNLRRCWTDGKVMIEEHLNAIINEFLNLPSRLKFYNMDLENKVAQRKKDSLIFYEKFSQKYHNDSIYLEAIQEAQVYKIQIILDDYLNQLEIQYLNKFGSLSYNAKSWINTVRDVAESKSALRKRIDLLNAL